MADEQTNTNPTPESVTGNTPAQTAAQAATDALNAATKAASAIAAEASSPSGSGGDGSRPVTLPDFGSTNGKSTATQAALGLLDDVTLNVKIELGRTRMYVEDVLRLNENSVVELDKAAGDPVDIYVNDRHVARGEVLVLNENFCVRVSEIIQQVGADD
jgi:flagellar motor switch protein FliN/FliY